MYRITHYRHSREVGSLIPITWWQLATKSKSKTTTSGPEELCTSSALDSLSWKTRLGLTAVTKIKNAARRPNYTLNRRLLDLIDLKSPPNKSQNGVVSSDVVVDPTRDLWFRLFVPENTTTSLPVVVYFHGGGFINYRASSIPFDSHCRRLAASIPAVVVSVSYRLSPEHAFPAPYDDGFDVLTFLLRRNNPNVLPRNADISRRLFLAGDSAGGNIAHHVAVRACKTKNPSVKVAGLISIQPFFGGEERTESELRLRNDPLIPVEATDWVWKAFLPGGSTRDHEVANVSGPNGEDISGLENYPPAFVFVGGKDPLQDWQRRYCAWLKRSGKQVELVELPRMFHGFYVFNELPETKQLLTRITKFVAFV